MVLESIIDPQSAKRHPLKLFFVGFLFAIVALMFSLWIFKAQTSLVMVFLTVSITVPLMYATMQEEEEEDLQIDNEAGLLKEHSKAILFLTSMFMGFVVAFSLVYIFFPADLVSMIFSIQLDTIRAINANVAKNLSGLVTYVSFNAFLTILANNIKVMLFCIFFAFFFGAGAIFILTWNASVISAAVGTYFRNGLENYSHLLGLAKVAAYFHLYSLSLLRFMIHGSLEIIAYFIGGLAGGIISIGLINHTLESARFKNIMFDAVTLILISIAVLVLAAFVEVFVTPVIFY